MVAKVKRADTVFYPDSDDIGVYEHQTFIRELLRPLLARWFAEKKHIAHAGSDQFFYWVPATIRNADRPMCTWSTGCRKTFPP